MDYLIALVTCVLTEGNRLPPANLKQSPLVVLHMVYEAINRVGWTTNALKSAAYMGAKGFFAPTINGRHSLKERIIDAFVVFAVPLIVSQYRDHAIKVFSSTEEVKGSMQRLWEMEKNPEVKKIFQMYVEDFTQKRGRVQPQNFTERQNQPHPLGQDDVCQKTA